MTTTTVSILLLTGAIAFTAGAFLATEIATRVLRARENRVSSERKRLNAAWKFLREVYDVHRSAWIEDNRVLTEASRKRRKSRRRRGTETP